MNGSNTKILHLQHLFIDLLTCNITRTHAHTHHNDTHNGRTKKHLARSHGFVECTKITNTLCECDVKIKIARLLLSPTGR